MSERTKSQANRLRRAQRSRTQVRLTSNRPRLTVHISNKHVTAQIIDDSKSATLVYATTAGHKPAEKTLTERAVWVGEQIGKKAKSKKIKSVSFDRGRRIYHGRIRALAEAARGQGLEF